MTFGSPAVKAKNYPENLAVLFINDGTSNTGVRHDGVTARSLWDGSPSADYGSVTDFIKGDVSVSTNYTASVDANGNVTMSGGSGGIGFVVLNTDSEIAGIGVLNATLTDNECCWLQYDYTDVKYIILQNEEDFVSLCNV